MAFIPSPQQADFLNWVSTGRGSCVLEAVAGAGKTTTILEAIDRTTGGVAILAFNKKIAEEIKAKLIKRGVDWKTAEAGTVHSFGLRAYRKAFPKVTIDGHKMRDLIEPKHKYGPALLQLVSLAKQSALGVIGRIDDRNLWQNLIDHHDIESEDYDLIPEAIDLLHRSNGITSVIDFDDMIYLPLLMKVKFWRHQWIFVDEAQDTNAARRALVRAMLAPGGRVVAVGDRHQAIYGFTGADADSLDLIAQDFNATRLPLTVTYRCPKSVVAFAQQWVSHIHAHESAPEGSVSQTTLGDFMVRNDLDKHAAVLCRNTKPLVELAFALIRRRIACRVEGRDLASGLIKLATKWKRVKTLAALEQALEKWLEQQRTKALAKKQEMMAQQAEDRVGTLQVIIDDCRAKGSDSVDCVVAALNEIFGDNVEDMLVLSTGHKAKGREWQTVFWLDRAGTIPSRYARQEWQIQQEWNIAYVIATRAQSQLVEILA